MGGKEERERKIKNTFENGKTMEHIEVSQVK